MDVGNRQKSPVANSIVVAQSILTGKRMTSGPVAGMLAVTRHGDVAPSEGASAASSSIGAEQSSTIDVGGVALAGSGFDLGGFRPGTPVLLSLTNWRHGASVYTLQIARWLNKGGLGACAIISEG